MPALRFGRGILLILPRFFELGIPGLCRLLQLSVGCIESIVDQHLAERCKGTNKEVCQIGNKGVMQWPHTLIMKKNQRVDRTNAGKKFLALLLEISYSEQEGDCIDERTPWHGGLCVMYPPHHKST